MTAKRQPATQDEWGELETACGEAIAALSGLQELIRRKRAQQAVARATVTPALKPVQASTPERSTKLLLTIQEAADALGIGITLLYDLLAKGHINSVKVGRRRLISVHALETYIARLEEEEQ